MIIVDSKILVKILSLGFANAITIFPFVFISSKHLKQDKQIINHEKIHLKQQLEMLFIFFYIWYLVEFFIRFIIYKSRSKAYFNISFEREAYDFESAPGYIDKRKFWAFLKYL